jgi:hypothetical protein
MYSFEAVKYFLNILYIRINVLCDGIKPPKTKQILVKTGTQAGLHRDNSRG